MSSIQIKLAGEASSQHVQDIENQMLSAGMDMQAIKRECSFALQIVSKSAQLQKCSAESLMDAILNIANTGLTLNPVEKQAYLVPRWNNKLRINEVTLDPSYMGLIYLAAESGGITSILAQVVYENEKGNITINIADNKNPVIHKIDPFMGAKGKPVGVYSVATFPNGTKQAEFMTIAEVLKIRERSETYKAFKMQKIKSCTWETDFFEMTRKTIIKRLIKYLPFVSSKLSHAVDSSSDYAPLEQIPTASAPVQPALPELSEEGKKIKTVSAQIRDLLPKVKDEKERGERIAELTQQASDFKSSKTPESAILDYLENYRDDLDLALTLNQSQSDS